MGIDGGEGSCQGTRDLNKQNILRVFKFHAVFSYRHFPPEHFSLQLVSHRKFNFL